MDSYEDAEKAAEKREGKMKSNPMYGFTYAKIEKLFIPSTT